MFVVQMNKYKQNNIMSNQDFRIVYMGTPEFAVEPLKTLLDNGFNVVGVITAPDKPAGRGHKMQFSQVKEFAVTRGLNILQPEKLKDPVFISELESLKADLFVVVAFRMLPKVVWAMPPKGTINLHASLLPQYRGAAPINWAVINGDKQTGVTTFFIEEEIDTGMIIDQQVIDIDPDENVGSVYQRLMELGSKVLSGTVQNIKDGTVKPISQSDKITKTSDLKAAPKISKDTCQINWGKTAREVHNLVRGFSPYPAAWTIISKDDNTTEVVKIFSTRPEVTKHNLQPGAIDTDSKHYMKIATTDGFVSVLEIQPAGKKRMDIGSFLNGHLISSEWKVS